MSQLYQFYQLLPALRVLMFIALLLAGGVGFAEEVWADPSDQPFACNTDLINEDSTEPTDSSDGIITTIAEEIKAILKDAYETLFEGIATELSPIASALIMLAIIIFGILYMIGMIQMPLNDVVKRLVKMMLVATIVSPAGFAFFDAYAYDFFIGGGDYIISNMLAVIAEHIDPANAAQYASTSLEDGEVGVFQPLDDLLQNLVKPETLSIFQALMSQEPYGPLYVALFVVGFIFLMGAIGRAIWVYLVAMIAITFLFGLAPIFITFILFQKTKNMFDGWVGQIVNYTLQPILMFTFIGFFIILMQISMKEILGLEVCFGECEWMIDGSAATAPVCMMFKDPGTGELMRPNWQADGKAECVRGGEVVECDMEFPVDIIDILTFILLGYVAFQFYNHVTEIANDVSGSFVNLEVASPVKGAIDQASSRVENAVSTAAQGGDVMRALTGIRSNP